MTNLEKKNSIQSHVRLEKRHNPRIRESLIQDESNKRIFYARKSLNDPEPKEIELANELANNFKTNIIFLPVRNIPGTKNPDIIIGREFAEMKVVTGNINAIGRNFRQAIKQANIVIMSIKKTNHTIKDIHRKITGEIQDLIRKDKWKLVKPESLIILINGKFHTWDLVKYQKYQ